MLLTDRETNKQTNQPTNAGKNITSLAEVTKLSGFIPGVNVLAEYICVTFSSSLRRYTYVLLCSDDRGGHAALH